MTTFQRDRFTWFGYLSIGIYAYIQAGLGPLMPFLRAELGLNFTTAGLHFSGFALGMIIAGSVTGALADRFGRGRIWWVMGSAMAASIVLFGLGRAAPVSIAMAFLMGLTGTSMLVAINASLSDHHGENLAIPLTESNIGASIVATVGALLIGAMNTTVFGWRSAIYWTAAAWVLLIIFFRNQPITDKHEPHEEQAKASGRLPGRYWVYFTVLFLGVSGEWCVVFWGADYLDTVVGFETSAAAAIMSVYFIANIIARVFFSGLTRTVNLSILLLAATVLALIGFVLYWLGPLPWLTVLGLFVAGLGISNLYPLGISAAIGSVGNAQRNLASSRVSLAAGLAILVMPQVLGILADQVGLKTAYSAVPLLFGAILVLVIASRRGQERKTEVGAVS